MSGSAVNIVKYYFHRKPTSPERMAQLVSLAYQTATDRQIYPKAIFIRSDVHDTTMKDGVRIKDPLGDHVTFSYKTQDQLGREVHVAAHGYVKDRSTMEFREATHREEKPDSTPKRAKPGKPAKVVWPSEDELWEAPEIGYGHLG